MHQNVFAAGALPRTAGEFTPPLAIADRTFVVLFAEVV